MDRLVDIQADGQTFKQRDKQLLGMQKHHWLLGYRLLHGEVQM